jgi:ferredoxin
VFGKIVSEMDAWLDAHGYAAVRDVRGLALRSAESWWAAGWPVVNEDACNGCDLCEPSCPYEAIGVVDELAFIDYERCQRCGLCLTRCHRDAISWEAAGVALG